MSNRQTRDAYRRKEKCVMYTFYLLIMLAVLVNVFFFLVTNRFVSFQRYNHIAYRLNSGFNIAEGIMLAILGLSLMFQLKSKYYFAYND